MSELRGYTPDHDFCSTLDTALAIRAGRETDVVPTGVRYGGADYSETVLARRKPRLLLRK